MKIFNCPKTCQEQLSLLSTKSLGFVPTMGGLHEGHLSLVQQAKQNCEYVCVSIFTNPTQFNSKADFMNYPKAFDEDIKLLAEHSVDYVFTPEEKNIYPDGYRYKVTEQEFSQKLCGTDRPGHFDGVLTVLMKLFNIVSPHKVYLGLKDYQQYALVKDMVKNFFMPMEVIGCPTQRDSFGLALSSRNKRLSKNGLDTARQIHGALFLEKLNDVRKRIEKEDLFINYLEDIKGRRFIAATIENVRIIDNVKK